MKPLAIDLYCGLGGWSRGVLDAGFYTIGFDIEQHVYGEDRYPGQLVIQDVSTLHGSQFKDAELIVASPPCQAYSYMAMPWKLGKAKAEAIRADETGQLLADLNRLFHACFRIQREACEAAGRHVPMVVENVRGAQPWVGRARWNFGSYYLWGDVPALMPSPGKDGVKVAGLDWNRYGQPGYKGEAFNTITATRKRRTNVGDGARFTSRDCGNESRWFNDGPRSPGSISSSSSSPRRKAASAKIAKIPPVLSLHIARHYFPQRAA